MAEANLKKQQMEYISIGLLVFVAVSVGVLRFKKNDKDDEVFSRNNFNKEWAEVEILEANIPEEKKEVTYETSDRIPFKGPFEEEVIKEDAKSDIMLPLMKFQGMIWSSTRPQAVIDNQVYDVGDTIVIEAGDALDSIKIKDIDREGIHLKYKGLEFLVRPRSTEQKGGSDE
ncbi:MAG: hypothetical protein KKH08_01750 [Candidatus Omnitrophica bacterium]|nr:hypothetical protein [Candidatus Omnitrophota bacterium]